MVIPQTTCSSHALPVLASKVGALWSRLQKGSGSVRTKKGELICPENIPILFTSWSLMCHVRAEEKQAPGL